MKLFTYALAIMCLLITACGGDTTGDGQTIITGITPTKESTTKNNTTGPSTPIPETSSSNSVVGKWTMTSSSAGANTTNQKLEFSSNGTVKWTSTQGSQQGTFTITGSNLNISMWGNHSYSIDINGNLLLVSKPNSEFWSKWRPN